MTDYGRQTSVVRPESIVIDDYSVWIYSNIQAMSEPDTGWAFNLRQYDKNEYIGLLAEKNDALSQEITDMQMALCDIYEGMV